MGLARKFKNCGYRDLGKLPFRLGFRSVSREQRAGHGGSTVFLCGRLAFLATQHLVLENSSLCRLIEGRAPLPVEKPEDQILASSAFSVDRELQHMTGRLK